MWELRQVILFSMNNACDQINRSKQKSSELKWVVIGLEVGLGHWRRLGGPAAGWEWGQVGLAADEGHYVAQLSDPRCCRSAARELSYATSCLPLDPPVLSVTRFKPLNTTLVLYFALPLQACTHKPALSNWQIRKELCSFTRTSNSISISLIKLQYLRCV